MSSDCFCKHLPSGVYFIPSDEEICTEYLRAKVERRSLPCSHVIAGEFVMYDQDDGAVMPWDLFKDDDAYWIKSPRSSKIHLYIFTRLKIGKKRAARKVGGGTWLGQNNRKVLNGGGVLVGYNKLFTYRPDDKSKNTGRDGEGRMIMHEFSLPDCQDYVLCRITKEVEVAADEVVKPVMVSCVQDDQMSALDGVQKACFGDGDKDEVCEKDELSVREWSWEDSESLLKLLNDNGDSGSLDEVNTNTDAMVQEQLTVVEHQRLQNSTDVVHDGDNDDVCEKDNLNIRDWSWEDSESLHKLLNESGDSGSLDEVHTDAMVQEDLAVVEHQRLHNSTGVVHDHQHVIVDQVNVSVPNDNQRFGDFQQQFNWGSVNGVEENSWNDWEGGEQYLRDLSYEPLEDAQLDSNDIFNLWSLDDIASHGQQLCNHQEHLEPGKRMWSNQEHHEENPSGIKKLRCN